MLSVFSQKKNSFILGKKKKENRETTHESHTGKTIYFSICKIRIFVMLWGLTAICKAQRIAPK